jgi:peptide/nickel transport system substrate-binding protein
MPSLRDVRVRQALSLAVDREGMARALLRDPGAAATQLLPPSVAGWHDVALSPLRHDLSAATRLLQAAGWQRQGLGWRDAQGQEVSLSLRTYPDRPELPLMATALQAQWQALGIPVQVQVGNSGDIPLGHRDGSLQLALAARNYGTVPNPGSTLLQDFGAAGSDWGAMGWRHGAVSEALHLLDRGVPSKRQAEALRRSVVQVLQHELPVIPIAWMRLQVAVGARVEGVSLDPLERSYRVTRMRWRG